MRVRPLVILGAGSFAIELLEAAELSGRQVRGFLVSNPSLRLHPTVEQLPVYVFEDLPWPASDIECIAGIVSTKRRAIVEAAEARGLSFTTLTHRAAIISPRARLAPGSFIGAGAIVAANTTIGSHVIVNRGANIAHDVDLGRYVTVGPNAVIAGAVTVGARAWLGVGSVIRDHLSIGEGAVVGAGALVVKPVAAHTLVVGSPALVVRDGVDGL